MVPLRVGVLAKEDQFLVQVESQGVFKLEELCLVVADSICISLPGVDRRVVPGAVDVRARDDDVEPELVEEVGVLATQVTSKFILDVCKHRLQSEPISIT